MSVAISNSQIFQHSSIFTTPTHSPRPCSPMSRLTSVSHNPFKKTVSVSVGEVQQQQQSSSSSSPSSKLGFSKRKRPGRLDIPIAPAPLGFCEVGDAVVDSSGGLVVEDYSGGDDDDYGVYGVCCKKGKRIHLEDRFSVDILASKQEYDTTISFYRAPYLVDVDITQGKRILMLDEISGNANSWRDVDVLVFNTGHWWTHQGSLQGWDYMESRGMWYQDMDRLSAMDHGLRTWARWVDSNIDSTKTKVFFQSISPTHYNPSEWSSGGTTTTKNCYGETTPAIGMAFPADRYPLENANQMRVLTAVLTEMSTPTYLLDITMLSAMRKDGHPSIYSGDLTPQQRANPYRSADCSHWCLPGLPDTWNMLFYTALLY